MFILKAGPAAKLGVLILINLVVSLGSLAQSTTSASSDVGLGWANNSVNTVIFRKNSLTTWKTFQFTAYYDSEGFVVLGKRSLYSKQWETRRTELKGNAKDAHNSISIIADGRGYLHVSWDHHNNPLHYAKSNAPGSLNLTIHSGMTGLGEKRVSYPEFYRLKSGNLLFLYRNGESGEGNLVMNRYSLSTGKWEQIQNNLVDGEKQRNAYCQTYIDGLGVIHLSWVWRETPDVASNHDLCYARSKDEGLTWERSDGTRYNVPINASTAEYACRIPQGSELINQTSMSADERGLPYIATYWRETGSSIPQYHVVYLAPGGWKSRELAFRSTPFSLSGAGTKRIPIARPQLLISGSRKSSRAILIFRDEERGNRVSIALFTPDEKDRIRIMDLTPDSIGDWEPTYDSDLWRSKKVLSLFLQEVKQVDGEGLSVRPPTMVRVLDWRDH